MDKHILNMPSVCDIADIHLMTIALYGTPAICWWLATITTDQNLLAE